MTTKSGDTITVKLRMHFKEVDWSEFYGAETMVKKCLSSLEFYNGIRRYVPKLRREREVRD